MCIEQWLIFRPDHRECTPGLLPFLCLLEQCIIEIMRSKGHTVDSLDDLGITFLLKLVILRKQFQKMRKTLLLILQHHPFQLPLQVKFLKDGMFLYWTDLCHFVTELLLMFGYFSRGEFDAEELDNGTEEIVYLLKEKIDGKGQDLKIDHPCTFLFWLLWPVWSELRSQLIQFLPQEVVLSLELLDLQEEKFLLLLRTDLLLTAIQTHQRSG